jgi:hypothetical protein
MEINLPVELVMVDVIIMRNYRKNLRRSKVMKYEKFICTQCNNPVKQPCCELKVPLLNYAFRPVKCPFGFENVKWKKIKEE